MERLGFSLLLVACLLFITVESDDKKPEPKVGEPQFGLQASGGGQNLKNFQAGYNAGVGTRVWESKNKDRTLDLGVNYGQGFVRQDGQTFKSKPQFGVGGTFRWGKK